MLSLQTRPDLGRKDPIDPLKVRQRLEQGLRKSEAPVSRFVDQFQRRDMGVLDAHLAIADHPIAAKLKAGEFKGLYLHVDRPASHIDISIDRAFAGKGKEGGQ